MEHQKFSYTDLASLRADCAARGIRLPLSENLGLLAQGMAVEKYALPNRLCVQPMEGCDGTTDGRPDELTLRRYRRFAAGGAGLIWVEATAVVPEGRANPRQLLLNAQTADSFKALAQDIRETALRENGIQPLLILQLTHSGRYSRPQGKPAPLIARNNPLFEKDAPLSSDCILSDDALAALPERYAAAAGLAEQAGFDGADVKSCHGYLLNELLASHTRPGRYGGSLENRSRLFLEAFEAARAATSFLVTSRMSLFDGFPFPYGWGTATDICIPDPTEPLQLIEQLITRGLTLLDCTIGNPYVNPHVNRPFDNGFYTPPEHPLEGLARMADCVAAVKKRFPQLCVVGSGYSYLRQLSPHFAAGMLENNEADIAGFGRMGFAYPDFAKDILGGAPDAKKCCLSCGKCSEIMRGGGQAGCVPRDAEIYVPIHKEATA